MIEKLQHNFNLHLLVLNNDDCLESSLINDCVRSSLAYGELEERLELLESSLTPVSPHIEERLELLESLLNKDQEEEYSRFTRSQEQGEYIRRSDTGDSRHNKRSADPSAYAEQVRNIHVIFSIYLSHSSFHVSLKHVIFGFEFDLP